jgi:hypothetical protein
MTKEMTAQARAQAKYYEKNKASIHAKHKAKNMTVTLPRDFVMKLKNLSEQKGVSLTKLIVDNFDFKKDAK